MRFETGAGGTLYSTAKCMFSPLSRILWLLAEHHTSLGKAAALRVGGGTDL